MIRQLRCTAFKNENETFILKTNRKRVNLTMTLEECNYYNTYTQQQLMRRMTEVANEIAERSVKGCATYMINPYQAFVPNILY